MFKKYKHDVKFTKYKNKENKLSGIISEDELYGEDFYKSTQIATNYYYKNNY